MAFKDKLTLDYMRRENTTWYHVAEKKAMGPACIELERCLLANSKKRADYFCRKCEELNHVEGGRRPVQSEFSLNGYTNENENYVDKCEKWCERTVLDKDEEIIKNMISYMCSARREFW